MKTVILAGGRGSRLGRETDDRPKPLVDIGGKPLVWHVLRPFLDAGLADIVIALGYRGKQIRSALSADSQLMAEARLTFVDTGLQTEAGGRVRRVASGLDGETFVVAYADGLTDLDIGGMVGFHRSRGRLASVLAVHPPPRFGHLTLNGDRVSSFAEKPHGAEGWINGGIYVFEPAVIERIAGDDALLERGLVTALADEGELMAWRHDGHWAAVDTEPDLAAVRAQWEAGSRPWIRPGPDAAKGTETARDELGRV